MRSINPERPFPLLALQQGEEALVIAAKNGNDHAFETLVERYRRRMLTVALRLTRVQEDAEDITQQSFQKAFVHLHTFEGKSSFSTWLTRITVNEALMLLRRGRGRREISIDEEPCELKEAARLEIPDSDPDPEATYLQREEARHFIRGHRHIKPGLRKAIELRDLEELSTEETARRWVFRSPRLNQAVTWQKEVTRSAEVLCDITSNAPGDCWRRPYAHLARSSRLHARDHMWRGC